MHFVGIDTIEADPDNPQRSTMTMWGTINFGSWMPSKVFGNGIKERMEAQYNNFQSTLRSRRESGTADQPPSDTWGKAVLRGFEENIRIDQMVQEAKRTYFGSSFMEYPQDPLNSDTE